MTRLVRYLWAFPATLVGLAFALVALAVGARAKVVDGVLEVGGGRFRGFVLKLPMPMRFGAITFGHVILGLDAATLAHCRAHEHVHVRQYERWGVLFFPLYLGSSAAALIAGKDPYRDNRFEREAYANENSARL
jgi:hypothetical protein